MNTTNNIHPSGVEVGEELIEVTGGGLRIAELAVVTVLGLLLCPPLLILAVIVAAPLLAIGAAVAAVILPIAAVSFLVGRVRAHHRAHGSTLFLHRLVRS